MERRKLLATIVSFVMLFTCCFGINAISVFAADEGVFIVSSESAKPGEEVTVTISIANNPGIITSQLEVHYDTGLTIKSVTDKGLLKGTYTPGGDLTANPYTISWNDATATSNNTSNGVIAEIIFTVSETATNGDYDIWVTFDENNVFDINMNNVAFTTQPGKVSVTGAACVTHSFTNYVSDNNATCVADGTKTAKCDNCTATDTVTDTGSATGHTFTNYVADGNATCTADGTKTAKCDDCTETDTVADTGSATGHTFTSYVADGNATCTADGTKTAKCDDCAETDTVADTGSAGHKFTNYVSDDNATCLKDGTKTAKCDNCDETDTITDGGSALGHSFRTYTECTPADCTSNAKEEAVCERCDATDVREVAGTKLEHKVSEWKTEKEATADATGVKTGVCELCKETIEEVIPKLVIEKEDTETPVTEDEEKIADTDVPDTADNNAIVPYIAMFIVTGFVLCFIEVANNRIKRVNGR